MIEQVSSDWPSLAAVVLVCAGVAAEIALLSRMTRECRVNRMPLRSRNKPCRRPDIRPTTAERPGPARAIAAIAALTAAPIVVHAQPADAPPPDGGKIPEAATEVVISPDRGSFSDGTGIQPVLRLNVETGYTFTFRNRDDVETQSHNAPELTLRVGVLEDRLEVRAVTSGYSWSRSSGDGSGWQSSEGWNDLSLGVKLKLLDQSGAVPRIALEAMSSLGIGSDNVSSQMAEPILKLLWSYDLGQAIGDSWKGFTFGGNANVMWTTTSGDRFTQAQWSTYLSFPIADKLSGFIEYYGLGPNDKGTDAAHYIDFGGTYLLNSRVQFDARVGFGLNEEADNFFTGAGVSFLF